MVDLKNLEKNMRKIIDWVNTADVVLTEIDETLKKNSINLENCCSDINRFESLISKLQENSENLNKCFRTIQDQISSLKNRLDAVENFVLEKKTTTEINSKRLSKNRDKTEVLKPEDENNAQA